jgi:hypothetical protein
MLWIRSPNFHVRLPILKVETAAESACAFDDMTICSILLTRIFFKGSVKGSSCTEFRTKYVILYGISYAVRPGIKHCFLLAYVTDAGAAADTLRRHSQVGRYAVSSSRHGSSPGSVAYYHWRLGERQSEHGLPGMVESVKALDASRTVLPTSVHGLPRWGDG